MTVTKTFGGFCRRAETRDLTEVANVNVSGLQHSDLLTYDAKRGIWGNKQLIDSTTITYLGTKVTQVKHGFGIMDQVYKNTSGEWALARADSASTLRTASVFKVVDEDTFVVIFTGVIAIPGHGFEVGQMYYLSATVAGAATTTPTDAIANYNQPVFTPLDADTLKVHDDIDTRLDVVNTGEKLLMKPSDLKSSSATAQLGTFGNNGRTPFADAIHFNTGGTSANGDQNALFLSKQPGIAAARLFQNTYASSKNFSRYKNFVLSDTNSDSVTLAKSYWRMKYNGSDGKMVAARLNDEADGPFVAQDYTLLGALDWVAGSASDTASLPSHRFYFQQDGAVSEFARFDGTDAYKAGGGTWTVMSDRRTKMNITPIDDGLAKLMRLRPVHFEFIEEVNRPGMLSGFIAQEVEEVFPEKVEEVRDLFGVGGTYKSLNPDFTAYMVAAVQDLARIIEKQQQVIYENNKLVSRVRGAHADIRAKLSALEKHIES